MARIGHMSVRGGAVSLGGGVAIMFGGKPATIVDGRIRVVDESARGEIVTEHQDKDVTISFADGESLVYRPAPELRGSNCVYGPVAKTCCQQFTSDGEYYSYEYVTAGNFYGVPFEILSPLGGPVNIKICEGRKLLVENVE